MSRTYSGIWPKTGIEGTLLPNPRSVPAFEPYLYRYKRFDAFTMSLGDTVAHPLSKEQLPVELIVVVLRSSQTGTVQVWREVLGNASTAGFTLNPGDSFDFEADNRKFDMASAFAGVMGTRNPLPRQSILANEWFVGASAATQVIDVMFGYGDEQ